jgi:hypothetical protein
MRRKMYTETCPWCAGRVEIQTLAAGDVLSPAMANPADELFCTLCQCEGVIFTYLGEQQSTWGPPCVFCIMRDRYRVLVAHIRTIDQEAVAIIDME